MKYFRTIVYLGIIVCLSLLHVHCSIYTADNPVNPATLMLMLFSENYAIVIFYFIQFAVTAFVSYFMLNYNSLCKWLISFIFVLLVTLYLNSHFWEYHHMLQHFEINAMYFELYGYKQAFTTAIICMFLQLLVIFSYLSFSYMESFFLCRKILNYFILKKTLYGCRFLLNINTNNLLLLYV